MLEEAQRKKKEEEDKAAKLGPAARRAEPRRNTNKQKANANN
jgi:hypothetical protein